MGNIPLLWIGAVIAAICGYGILNHFCKWPREKRGTNRGVATMLTGFLLFGAGSSVFIVRAIVYFLIQ